MRVAVAGEGSKGVGGGGVDLGGRWQDLRSGVLPGNIYQCLRYCSSTKISGGLFPTKRE